MSLLSTHVGGEDEGGHTNGNFSFLLIQAEGVGVSSLEGPRAFFLWFGGKMMGTVSLAVVAVTLGARGGGCHQGELAGAAGVGQGWGRAGSDLL